jgi:ribonuclease G
MNVGERETRIAVLEDSRLTELHYERDERVVGSIFKARVENVLPGMDAAFVDIGLNRNAFLYVGDVLPSSDSLLNGGDQEDSAEEEDDEPAESSSDGHRRRRAPRRSALRQQKIADVLKVGQEILVQVIKGPRGTKGARVSTRISLPGRYLVLMPESDNIGISRKITDGRERERLRKIAESLRQPGFGIIVRTEAEDKTAIELQADMEYLYTLWQQILENGRKHRAPALIHKDLSLVNKTVRDIFGSDVSRMVIDDPDEYENADNLLSMVSPKLRGRIQLYSEQEPIFDHYNIEAEIEKTLKRKVWLRSGGYIILDETEALTVIDVNTGKFVGGGSLSETILKTNLDAANEIARQLRLRDIGGIIVIDFIDMNNPKDRQQVIKALEAALKRDRARTKISSISGLGLVEMTRKRTAETVTDFLTAPCPACGGRGKVFSPETVSVHVEREMHRAAMNPKTQANALLVMAHPSVAEILIGPDGEEADRLERDLRRAVFIRSHEGPEVEHFEVTSGDLAEFERKYGGQRRAQVVECRIARSVLQPEPAVVAWANGFMLMLSDSRRAAGQRGRARINDVRRSYASAALLGT